MAHYHYRRTVGLPIFREESPPEQGIDAQHGKEIGRDLAGPYLVRPGDSGDIQPPGTITGQVLEDLVVLAQKPKVPAGPEALVKPDAPFPKADQTMWIAIGQGTQHDGIDHAEQRGVGRNGHRQDQDRDGRETGIFSAACDRRI